MALLNNINCYYLLLVTVIKRDIFHYCPPSLTTALKAKLQIFSADILLLLHIFLNTPLEKILKKRQKDRKINCFSVEYKNK